MRRRPKFPPIAPSSRQAAQMSRHRAQLRRICFTESRNRFVRVCRFGFTQIGFGLEYIRRIFQSVTVHQEYIFQYPNQLQHLGLESNFFKPLAPRCIVRRFVGMNAACGQTINFGRIMRLGVQQHASFPARHDQYNFPAPPHQLTHPVAKARHRRGIFKPGALRFPVAPRESFDFFFVCHSFFPELLPICSDSPVPSNHTSAA